MVLKEDIAMIEVSIPSMEPKVDESGKSKKVRKVFNLLSASFHVARCHKRRKLLLFYHLLRVYNYVFTLNYDVR